MGQKLNTAIIILMKPPTGQQKKKYSRYLSSGEQIVAVFGIGDKYFWYNFISLLPLAIPFIIGFPFLLKLLHQRHSLKYILTNRRVIIKEGILTTQLTTAPYEHITHLSVKEKFLHRVSFQVGDIIIHTAGPTPVEIHLYKVQHPLSVKNLIEELIIKEKTLHLKSPLVKSL